jgi:hypothetical protein
MRKLCLSIVVAFIPCSAHAFCLFSCTPSEANARSVFENLVKAQYKGNPVNILSFEKTNGVGRTVFGQEIYEVSYKALVELPNGANQRCKPPLSLQNMGDCVLITYYPPGQKLTYSESKTFEKTERGWKGQDGNLY